MTKHIIDADLIRRIIGKMNMIWQKTDETEELRAILAQPAADCGLEVAGYGVKSDLLNKWYLITHDRYCLHPNKNTLSELCCKSDADARDAMRLERIAELEFKLEVAKTDELNAAVWAETEAIKHDLWDAQKRIAELEDGQYLRNLAIIKMGELEIDIKKWRKGSEIREASGRICEVEAINE